MQKVGRKYELFIRYAVFFTGMTILALGIVLCIQARLGVSSWDVLQIGLSYVTPLTIGAANVAVGILLVIITVFLERRRPSLGCLINIIYIGACIDFFLFLGWVPAPEAVWLRSILLITGIAMMGFGSGMYVMARRGAGPRDGLTIALVNKTGWSVRKVRTILEVTVLIIGWWLGGPVFIGTLLAALIFGPVMQQSMEWWGRWIERLLRRGVVVENLNQGALRLNDHDGLGREIR